MKYSVYFPCLFSSVSIKFIENPIWTFILGLDTSSDRLRFIPKQKSISYLMIKGFH